ncbi:hypothetical protein CR513_57249, partial [Mucuna pruriens]
MEFKKALQKVELPNFDGSDPIEWITKVEKGEGIFGFIYMEGVVVHWFKYLKKRQLHMTWESYKRVENEICGESMGFVLENNSKGSVSGMVRYVDQGTV